MSKPEPTKDDMSWGEKGALFSHQDDTQTLDVLYLENDQLKRDIKLLEDRLHEYECSVNTAPMFFAMKIEERLDKLDNRLSQILDRIPWERVQ